MTHVAVSYADPYHTQALLPQFARMEAAESLASLLARASVCRTVQGHAPQVAVFTLVITPCPGTPAQAGPIGTYAGFIGQTTGDGQCVALVKAIHPGLGFTTTWQRGPAVQGNMALQPGTVIATFAADGRYTSATDGSSHTAIYLGQNTTGVEVLDQWRGQPAAVRTIPWTSPGGSAADNGRRYFVVDAS